MKQQMEKIQKRLEELADKAHQKASKAKTAYQKAQHRATASGLHEAWRLVEQAARDTDPSRRRQLGPLSEVLL